MYHCSVPKYELMTDEELLMTYRTEGNREAFEELVKRYERELYSFLRRYLGHAEMAEDVFQATFFQIHKKCRLFEEGRAFRPWMYRIATNQAIDAKRRNKKHFAVSLDMPPQNHDGDWNVHSGQLVSDESDPGDSAATLEHSRQVRDAIEQLPEGIRQVLYLVFYQGMKYSDAAETLGVSFGTIKTRLNTAFQRLHHVLAKAV